MEGAGLLQERWRVLLAGRPCGLQAAEHSPQLDHPDQNPSTAQTDSGQFQLATGGRGSAWTCVLTGTRSLTDCDLGALASTQLPAVPGSGLVTLPHVQLKPLPTGGGALPDRRPRPPAAIHCRIIQSDHLL